MKFLMFRVNDDFHQMMKEMAVRHHMNMTQLMMRIMLPVLLKEKEVNKEIRKAPLGLQDTAAAATGALIEGGKSLAGAGTAAAAGGWLSRLVNNPGFQSRLAFAVNKASKLAESNVAKGLGAAGKYIGAKVGGEFMPNADIATNANAEELPKQPPATNNVAPQGNTPTPTATPQVQPQAPQGGGLSAALGKLDPAKPAYAAGSVPQQTQPRPTGVAPGTQNTPDATPAAKSMRFAITAYQRGDFSATMKALHKAVTEDPRLAKEFSVMLQQMAIEQEERRKRGISTQ